MNVILFDRKPTPHHTQGNSSALTQIQNKSPASYFSVNKINQNLQYLGKYKEVNRNKLSFKEISINTVNVQSETSYVVKL